MRAPRCPSSSKAQCRSRRTRCPRKWSRWSARSKRPCCCPRILLLHPPCCRPRHMTRRGLPWCLTPTTTAGPCSPGASTGYSATSGREGSGGRRTTAPSPHWTASPPPSRVWPPSRPGAPLIHAALSKVPSSPATSTSCDFSWFSTFWNSHRPSSCLLIHRLGLPPFDHGGDPGDVLRQRRQRSSLVRRRLPRDG